MMSIFTEDFWDTINLLDDISSPRTSQESSECSATNNNTNKRKRKRNDARNMFGNDDEM
jgi:hypothetical protein